MVADGPASMARSAGRRSRCGGGRTMRPDFTALRELVRGPVVTAFDPGYEPARVLFNTRIRTRPAAIVRCLETADVVTALAFAREHDLPFSVKSGGHNASGLCLVQDGLVIDVGDMRAL